MLSDWGMGYRCENVRFPVSKTFVKISNTDLPSTSSEFLEYDADKKYSE
jgi:hypothetical protein